MEPPFHPAPSMPASGSSAVPTPSALRRGDDLYQTRRTLTFPDGPKSAAAANDDAGDLDEPGLHWHFWPMAPGAATNGNSFMARPRTEDNLVIERLDNIFATLKLVAIRLDDIDARQCQDRLRMDRMEARMNEEPRVAAAFESPRKNEEKAASAKTTPVLLARPEGFKAIMQVQQRFVRHIALA